MVQLQDSDAETLTRAPHLLLDVLMSKDNRSVVFPTETISQEKQETQDGGRMRRTTDLKAADVVFDGTTCFLQADVEQVKLSIVDSTGQPVLTFQVDSPFPVEFPPGGDLFCIQGGVTTYFVEGWE